MRWTVRPRPVVHLRPSMENFHGPSSESVHEMEGPSAPVRRALSNAARLMFVSENSKRWIACAGFLLISYWGIKCGIVKFIMIILLKDSFNFRMSSFLDEFYFRWWENSVIEIGKAVSIPLMFNHQNWNFYSSSRAEASFCKDEMKLELWTDDWCKRQRVSHL